MRPVEYTRPETLEEATAILADGGIPLAGGTDLLGLLKDEAVTPHRLVDLKGIEHLDRADVTPRGVRIGALARLEVLAGDRRLKSGFPALAEAFAHVGSPQIRNRGTLGGNLLQRPRCWYFRRGYGLIPRLDGRNMVRDGDNRYHAVFATDGDVLFVTPSTIVPLLSVLGADATIVGAEGPRQLPVADLYRIPASDSESEHALAAGEILASLWVPSLAGRTVATYEVRPGKSLDWSLATAAVSLERDGGRVRNARVVLGQVAPVPWRSRGAEEALAGSTLDEDSVRAAAEAAVNDATPLSMNAYKVQLARVAVERALTRAAGREVPS